MSEKLSQECPLCRGAGFVYPLLPSGHPDFGRVVPCQCTKGELAEESLSRLQRYSNLGPLSRLTFDTLNPEGRTSDPGGQQRFAQAYEGAKAFAAEPQGWLVLWGVSGCGKTHLAAAIANHCILKGRPALFIVVADLLDHLRATFSPQSEISYDELFDQVRNAPVLILDDLGTQTTTPWAKEKLYQIINHRYNTRLPTVITTNTPLEELDERLYTRLTDADLSEVYLVGKREPQEYIGDLGLELLSKMDFQNFEKRLNLPAEKQRMLEDAYKLARRFAQAPEGWLVLMGPNGCGKTHLAAAIANHRLREGKSPFLIVVPDFLDHLRSTFSPESKVTYDELFERVKKAPLLVLDDFGEQSSTPWAQEKLYQVINYRYNARLPTVITTCFALGEIESRISSRMVDPRISIVFNIDVPDFRGDFTPSERRKPQRGRRIG
ncbi:MAG: ATP-binding protein [Dehalococcoidia bacterium]